MRARMARTLFYSLCSFRQCSSYALARPCACRTLSIALRSRTLPFLSNIFWGPHGHFSVHALIA